MKNSVHVIVASRNPVKINAVKTGFEKVFPDEKFIVSGVSVASNVSDQPMTQSETKKGAFNRAKNARKDRVGASYWVGIEGGIQDSDTGMESFAWVYILSDKKIGIAKTASFFLPKQVAQLVHQGIELGEANDIVFDKHNSKQQNGAVGLLTANLIDRTSYYADAVILALIPFFNKELYR
jgi:inosine/xanthosine triphosphatase